MRPIPRRAVGDDLLVSRPQRCVSQPLQGAAAAFGLWVEHKAAALKRFGGAAAAV